MTLSATDMIVVLSWDSFNIRMRGVAAEAAKVAGD
jgi:hypothetical protein